VKDANKTETGTVSLDVKNLRNMLKSSLGTGKMKVRVRYYTKKAGGVELTTTTDTYALLY
ncbi:MAG: hypothetical protein WBI58_08080, partial [Dysgonamonadaceae bacterium]